jgi:hypothetical protein
MYILSRIRGDNFRTNLIKPKFVRPLNGGKAKIKEKKTQLLNLLKLMENKIGFG